jgi:hypothetical protein
VQPGIPNSKAVESTFRLLEKRLQAALKRVNSEAAKRTKANDYRGATSLMQVGESVADFARRAGDFSREWHRLAKASRISAGSKGEPKTAGAKESSDSHS